MAIGATYYMLFREMFQSGLLPQGGALLEIGEANWYGDMHPFEMIADIQKFVADPVRQQALIARIQAAVSTPDTFEVVKVFYELYLAPRVMEAVDFGGTKHAMRLDLNVPLVLDRKYDLIVNHGTAEHIFNIAQVFRSTHEYTVPGGLMIHESPLTGWVDHGFYNLQPTLFFDLAAQNEYVICGMFVEEIVSRTVLQIHNREDVYRMAQEKQIPDNSLLFTILRKTSDNPFRLPIQGYYARSLSEQGMAAWSAMR